MPELSAILLGWATERRTRTAMIPDLDIYRSAKVLVDQHGEDAPIFAAQQADRCLEAGDLDGKR